MILDVTQVIIDFDGKPAQNGDGTAATMRDMIVQALTFTLNDERITGDDKTRAFIICARVATNDKVKLSSKDCEFILRRSGVVNPVLAHGRLTEAIDGPLAGDEDDEDSDGGDDSAS